MSTATAAAPARARSIQARYVALAIYVLMGLVAVYHRDLQLLDPNSFLRQRYARVPWWILFHGAFGALALILGVFQFFDRLRQRHLQVHRIMGRLYVAGVAMAAPAAIPVAIILGPPALVMAAVIQASGWVLTTAIALYCVRTGRIQQHREWMMRSYPFAMVFVVVRAILAIPAIERMGELGLVSVVWSAIATACFLPSFLIGCRAVFASKAPASIHVAGRRADEVEVT